MQLSCMCLRMAIECCMFYYNIMIIMYVGYGHGIRSLYIVCVYDELCVYFVIFYDYIEYLHRVCGHWHMLCHYIIACCVIL